MLQPRFITAIGTPMAEGDQLHVEGLAAHLEEQWAAGMTGVLIAGTMGLLQLLSDHTYSDLVQQALAMSRGRGERLVGAGDQSFARTRDRIRFLNGLDVDGVVLISPSFLPFSQGELCDYYAALAEESRAPIYLYNLPQLTRVKLEVETVVALSRHANIRGIKASGDVGYARQLQDALSADFRVVVAVPDLIDVMLRIGMRWHLDGIYCLAPAWTTAIGRCAVAGDWHEAARYQRRIISVLTVLKSYGVFPAMTAILNARGVAGSFCPRPMRMLSSERVEALCREPVVQELLRAEAMPVT